MGLISFIKDYKDKKRRAEEEKRKAEEQREANFIAEQKRIYRLTKTKIDNYIKNLEDQDYAAYQKANESHFEYAKSVNSKCPHCGSFNVHSEYKKIVGELNGNVSSHGTSSYSHGLFSGSSFSSYNSNGKIDGSLDTIQILKCSDCGHEWESVNTFLNRSDYYDGKIDFSMNIKIFMIRILDILEIKYDPKDITEKFDSYEEKRAAEIKRLWEDLKYSREYMKTLPIEVLWFLAVKYDADYINYLTKNSDSQWWSYTHYDEYICEFSRRVLILLEELGFKHINLD